jgi:purine nucleoside phosphorylase
MVKTLAIIGGSGLESLAEDGLKVHVPISGRDDKFQAYKTKIGDVAVTYIPRHGDEHQNLPLDVPYEAIFEFLDKAVNPEAILSFSATGTLDENVALANTGSFTVPDDFLRGYGFLPISGRTDYMHAEMSSPFNPQIRAILSEAGQELGQTLNGGGIYVLNEGHQFETGAEIALLNAGLSYGVLVETLESIYNALSLWHGSDKMKGVRANINKLKFPGFESLSREHAQVGMTAVKEAILAAEYKVPYAVVAAPVNLGAGMTDTPPSHEETMAVIEGAKKFIKELACKTVEKLATVDF